MILTAKSLKSKYKGFKFSEIKGTIFGFQTNGEAEAIRIDANGRVETFDSNTHKVLYSARSSTQQNIAAAIAAAKQDDPDWRHI